MFDFKQIWRKIAAQLKGRDSSRGSQEFKHALQAKLDNVRQLVAQASDDGASKMADLQQRVVQANDESAHKLADLQLRVEHAEAEHNQMQRHVQGLRTELHDATARQETAENRARELETELKREHIKQLELTQQIQDRERELERRTGRTMWIASAALLLGAMSSAAMMWSMRSNDRMLAELGKDIRDIKLSMTQQPARDLNPPVAEAFPGPPVTVPEAFPDQQPAATREVSTMQPPETDRENLLPYSSAVNMGYPDSLSKFDTTRMDAKTFFEENARDAGIITLTNGTQYRVLSRGIGRTPTVSDKVIVDYRAFTLDGREFDSAYSDQDAEAATFTVDEVIPGWKEALLHMKEGSQWELYIPPDLAHKGRTRKRGMLGFEPLIYVIELKSVIDTDESSPDQ
jgi:FKBP-type peptidyl-prolyl cis-trans isomerase